MSPNGTEKAAGSLRMLVVALILLAASFHFLTTIDVGGIKLRIGVADLLLPVLVVFALWHSYSVRRFVFRWSVPRLPLWLIVLSCWMLVALLVGYFHTGSWQTWAIVNKTLGWFVLTAYFLLGGSLGANTGVAARDGFLKAFLTVGWCICAYEVGMYAANYHGILRLESYNRIQGFFANPNAFGFAVAVIVVIQAAYLRRRPFFPLWVNRLGLGLALLSLLLSSSRSALFGLVLAFMILLWLRELDLREILIGIALAAALGLGSLHVPWHITQWVAAQRGEPTQIDPSRAKRPAINALHESRFSIVDDAGIQHRLEVTRNALDAWRNSPILGIGLGSFYWEQRQLELEYPPAHIHNTLLWLLTETGLIGALLFGGFFACCLWACIGSVRGGYRDPFVVATIGILMISAGASIGMETMYQRHVWLLLGWALTLPYPVSDDGLAQVQ